MESPDFEKFAGKRVDIDPVAAAILREFSDEIHEKEKSNHDAHPAHILKKLMFDTVVDPFRSPEEKWKWLAEEKQAVHGMVSGEYKEYELAPTTQFRAFLLCALAIFAQSPDLRKRPGVIARVQDVWGSYAEQSEVGDHRNQLTGRVGRPTEQEAQQMARARKLLPPFLALTAKLLDVVKTLPESGQMDTFAYWSQYIPEIKDLKKEG